MAAVTSTKLDFYKSHHVRPIEVLTLLTLLAIASAYAVPAVIASFGRYSRNFNEGWNVVKAMTVASGEQLYPADPGLTPTNYFPVSFHVIAALRPLFPNALAVGRVVAAISLGAIAVLIGVFSYRITRDRWSSTAGALMLIAALAGYESEYVAMNDPQMLAHALVLFGVAVATRRPESSLSVSSGGFVVAVGLLTKHNVIAFPAGLALWWLLHRQFRQLLAFVVAGASASVLLALAAATVDGPGMLTQVLQSRPVTIKQSVQQFVGFATDLYPFIAAAVLAMVYFAKDLRFRMLTVTFLVALTAGFLFSGGMDVGKNVYFDLLICCVAIAAACLGSIRTASPILGCAAALVLCGNLALKRIPTIPKEMRDTRAALTEKPQLHRKTVEVIRSRPGPVLCEDLLVCFDAGKPVIYDRYATRHIFATKPASEREFIHRIRSSEFAAIQLYQAGPPLRPEDRRFAVSEAFEEAVFSAYKPIGTFGKNVVFVPK